MGDVQRLQRCSGPSRIVCITCQVGAQGQAEPTKMHRRVTCSLSMTDQDHPGSSGSCAAGLVIGMPAYDAFRATEPGAVVRRLGLMIHNMPGCAALLVKSRTSAGICRNLNRILCFHDAHGFSEIGFVRRIFPISPVRLGSSACFCTPSGQLKRTSTCASKAVMPGTYWAHTRHTRHASARVQYAEYVPRMRFDDGKTRPTHHSCQIATTALGPAAVLTVASATSAMIDRTG